jgi:hypothetical protein
LKGVQEAIEGLAWWSTKKHIRQPNPIFKSVAYLGETLYADPHAVCCGWLVPW